MLSTTNVEKPITNSYEELDKLPQKYNSELAQKNGDVVNSKVKDYNVEKLDKFIDNYKNKKAKAGDMVRITKYTTEGDAIICDLIIDNKLDIKCNNPAAQLSSNPYDYTKDSQDYRDCAD